jgi:hypothetical protein
MQRGLRRQGLSKVTRDNYGRAVRRLEVWVNSPLDQIALPLLKDYLSALIESRWSTVKADSCGLRFFYAQMLQRAWDSVNTVRAPHEQPISDVLQTEGAL